MGAKGQLKHLLWSAMVAIFIWFARYVVAYGNTFHQFSSGHSGIVCPNEYVIFESVTSLISCSVMCQHNSDCEGLDYNENTKICRGCRGLKGAGCNYQPVTYDVIEGTKTFTKGRGFLVSGIGPIPDENLAESSAWSSSYTAKQARYCHSGIIGPWVTPTRDTNQWIQAEFRSDATVTGVYMLPRYHIQYVTSYVLYTSNDCTNYVNYNTAIENAPDVFPGINASTMPVTTILPTPVHALCVRINPRSWYDYIAMYFDIIGYYP